MSNAVCWHGLEGMLGCSNALPPDEPPPLPPDEPPPPFPDEPPPPEPEPPPLAVPAVPLPEFPAEPSRIYIKMAEAVTYRVKCRPHPYQTACTDALQSFVDHSASELCEGPHLPLSQDFLHYFPSHFLPL